MNPDQFAKELHKLTGVEFVHRNGNIEHHGAISEQQSYRCAWIFADSGFKIRHIEQEQEIDAKVSNAPTRNGFISRVRETKPSSRLVGGNYTIAVIDIPKDVVDKIHQMAQLEDERVRNLHEGRGLLNQKTQMTFAFDAQLQSLVAQNPFHNADPDPSAIVKSDAVASLSRDGAINREYAQQGATNLVVVRNIDLPVLQQSTVGVEEANRQSELQQLRDRQGSISSAVARLDSRPDSGRSGAKPPSDAGVQLGSKT